MEDADLTGTVWEDDPAQRPRQTPTKYRSRRLRFHVIRRHAQNPDLWIVRPQYEGLPPNRTLATFHRSVLKRRLSQVVSP